MKNTNEFVIPDFLNKKNNKLKVNSIIKTEKPVKEDFGAELEKISEEDKIIFDELMKLNDSKVKFERKDDGSIEASLPDDRIIFFEPEEGIEDDIPITNWRTSDIEPYMNEKIKPSDLKNGKVDVEENVTSAQLHSIAQWARGLRRKEAEVVLDNLPLDLIFTKIGKELEKNKRFAESITKAMDIIK